MAVDESIFVGYPNFSGVVGEQRFALRSFYMGSVGRDLLDRSQLFGLLFNDGKQLQSSVERRFVLHDARAVQRFAPYSPLWGTSGIRNLFLLWPHFTRIQPRR